MSKHRKKQTCNLSINELQEFTLDLSVILDESYWDREGWCDFKQLVLALLQSLIGYIQYLSSKNKAVRLHHKSPTPVREISNNLRVRFLSPSCVADSNLHFKDIGESLIDVPFYEHVDITNSFSSDPAKNHCTLNNLVRNGLSFPSVLLTYSPGSNIGNMHFLWRVPSDVEPVQCLEASQHCVETARQLIPVYHTRQMRSEMFKKFGRVSPAVKPAVLRHFYKSLTGKQTSCYMFIAGLV